MKKSTESLMLSILFNIWADVTKHEWVAIMLVISATIGCSVSLILMYQEYKEEKTA